MIEGARHKHIAAQRHQREQHRADDREADNPPQHNFRSVHRLGDDRGDGAILHVGRQTERADQQRHQQHQVGRGRHHESQIQRPRLRAGGVEKPTGKHQHHAKRHQGNPHASANGFVNRQSRQSPDAPRGDADQILCRTEQRPIQPIARRQRSIAERRHQVADRQRSEDDEKRRLAEVLQRLRKPDGIRLNFLFKNHGGE